MSEVQYGEWINDDASVMIGDRLIANVIDPDHPQRQTQQSVCLARRIAVCVNACAGMANPAAEIDRLRAALAEAREAFKLIECNDVNPKTSDESPLTRQRRMGKIARDFLAKHPNPHGSEIKRRTNCVSPRSSA